MKRLFVALLLTLPLVAYAQQARTNYCLAFDNLVNYAATYRDMRMSPQEVLEKMKPMETAQFPEPFVKALINKLYFDPDFSRLSAQQIVPASFKECLRPTKTYTPLQ